MSAGKPEPLVIHGWTVFAHPLFLAHIEALVRQVESLKQKDPVGYVKKNASKRLAAITKLAFDVIPQDPTRPEYRQGGTLGDDHKHWFRAKFFQQYRLFFRYHAPSKMIVYAWVNDEDTKRAYDVSGSIRSGRVIDVLARRIRERGEPAVLRSDNGPEFVSKALLHWAIANGLEAALIEPGKPWQNGANKSFKGTLRDECLSIEWFRSRAEAKVVIEAWRRHYNDGRPHSSLGYLTPTEFHQRYRNPSTPGAIPRS